MSDEFDDPTLIDPDGEEESRYGWDEEFQRHIIALLVSDRQFLLQSLDLVKPSYFANKAHQKVCHIVFDFFKKYRILPRKEFIVQEVKDQLRGNKGLPYFLSEVVVLYDYFKPGLDQREYLQDKITYFAKIEAVKKAFNDSLKEIAKAPESEDTWETIYDKMRTAMTTHQKFDVGIDYFKSIKDRYVLKEEQEESQDRFVTGIEGIDKEISGGGYIRGEIISFVAGSGVGKCFAKNTPVLMFDGTIKMVEDIRVGDLVMGDDSTARLVLKLHSGYDEMYDIIPVKGEKYTVNSRHTLVLKSTSKSVPIKDRCIRPRYWNSQHHKGDGVFEIEVSDYLSQSQRFQNILKGIRTGIDFPSQDVLINPYILGVWLGDGTSRTTDFTVSDPAILKEIAREAEQRKLILNPKEDRGKAKTYSITTGRKGSRQNSLRNSLKYYDLLQNKHIPHVYKINDRNTRLQILAGLIDTDGSKSNNCFDFVNKNKCLAKDVLFIARSLGFAAYIKPCKKASQNGTVGDYWRVTISGDLDEVPVRVAYKRCASRQQIKDPLVTGIKVVPVGRGQYFGFETDGNHRFLLSDFTVVHNSVMLACFTATNLLRGKKGVYISLELAEQKIADRFDAILTGFPIQCLCSHKTEIEEALMNLNGVEYNEVGLGSLIIKQFPAGMASVNTVRAYLSQLRFRGFNPDFVVVDYVGEMQPVPGIKTHESREKIVRDLRGMATEENIFLATAMQPNRDSKKDGQKNERGKIDEEHLADSFGQIRPLDGCFSLNQNDNEKTLGIGRLYVIKQRDGKSRYQLYLSFNQQNLKITEIHNTTYREKLNSHKEYASEQVKVDQVVGTWPGEEPDDEE